MADIKKVVDTAKADAVKVYGFWNKVGAFVASNPKTSVAIAITSWIVVAVVAYAL